MHENNFEKQVREKMDQLGFDPSDSVWERVDEEINKEEKRRRPLFWLFLLSGLVLAGGVYYFSTYKNYSTPVEANYPATDPGKNQDNLPGGKPEINTNEDRKENERDKNYLKTGAQRNLTQNHIKHDQIPKSTAGLKTYSRSDQKKNTGLIDKPAEVSASLNSVKEETTSNNRKDAVKLTDSAAGKKSVAHSENKAPVTDTLASTKDTGSKNEKKKSSAWKIGFTGNAGFSNINQDLFKSITQTNQVNYSAGAPNPPNGAPLPVNYSSSDIHAGFSFSIGAFVNRDLSNRISFSAGIGYHYYSTKILTGNYVDSLGFVYPSSGMLSSVNAYYRNGKDHSYTSHYHFIELPVTINFQINKSKQMPVIWEAGLTLSYLLASNALYYDRVSNVYYENKELMNKTQLNGVTAVMVGFPLGNAALELGPQLQYGFTGLLKNTAGNPGHLICYGLKINFIPGKK
jgi:hypothetical protein